MIAALQEYVADAHATPGSSARVTVRRPGVRAPPFPGRLAQPCRPPAGRMSRAFGREVLFTGEGGSGPEADLAEILGAPLVFVAVGLDADRIHAPNEKVDMDLLLKGAEAAAYLWQELAESAVAPGASAEPRP